MGFLVFISSIKYHATIFLFITLLPIQSYTSVLYCKSLLPIDELLAVASAMKATGTVGTMVALLAVLSASSEALKALELLYEWDEVDFVFPSPEVRDAMIENKQFVVGNLIPLDVDYWNGGNKEKTFITLPRFNPGTPATLTTVALGQSTNPKSPKLEPYPDWSWHQQGDCEGITSVCRIQVDSCNRLWVLDTGVVEFLTARTHICPPQILVFDLNTDKLLHRFKFTGDVVKPISILNTVTVDVKSTANNCRETYAYISDVKGYAIVVYDLQRDDAWRVVTNYAYPYPESGYFNIDGAEFDLMDGVLGLALSPVHSNGKDKTLYFHSLTSVKESWVATSLLTDKSLYKNGFNSVSQKFHVSQHDRKSQTGATAMDSNGILYFNLLEENTLNCWNSAQEYKTSNFGELYKDNFAYQFASGMKVARNKENEEEVWSLTSRFQNIMVGRVNQSEINYRVFKGSVKKMLENSKCRDGIWGLGGGGCCPRF